MAEGQEQAGAVVGKPAKSRQAGETPRQRIRKAKATTRRQLPAEKRIPPEACSVTLKSGRSCSSKSEHLCGCYAAMGPALQASAERSMCPRGQRPTHDARAASAAADTWDPCRTWPGWRRRRCSIRWSGDASLGRRQPRGIRPTSVDKKASLA